MRKSIIFLIGLLSLCLLIGSAAADPPVIDGYYQIGTVSDLQWFYQHVNNGERESNAKLTADIDLTGIRRILIGTKANAYNGTFDGDGYTISNFGSSDNAPIIYGGEKAVIKNTRFKNIRTISPMSGSILLPACVLSLSNGSTCYNCGFENCVLTFNYGGVYQPTGFAAPIQITGGGTATVSNCYSIGGSYTCNGKKCDGEASGVVGSINSSATVIVDKTYSNDDLIGNIVQPRDTQTYTKLGGIYSGCNANTTKAQISNSVFLGTMSIDTQCTKQRIFGDVNETPQSLSNNYASSSLSGYSPTGVTTVNGADCYADDSHGTNLNYHKQTFWQNTLGWDFTNTWYWDPIDNLPKLRVTVKHPIIESLTLTSPAHTPLQDAHITAAVNATSLVGAPLSYQWAYSTDAAATWTNITGQTADTLSFTPPTTGVYLLKVKVSDETGVIDSYEAGFTNIKVNVINAYTPQTVTVKTSSIQAKTSDSYQALLEFDFDANANISEAEWITNNRAYIAAGNAVYEVLGDTAEINPVASWTGNTISKAYLGNTRAIINDIDNNVAVYTYATHQPQYITANGSNVLAVTERYAAVLQSGTLNIYNNTRQIQASVASAAENLAANDNTDIFAYYSGRTLYYYTISNNTATQHTATPVPTDYTITSLQQIRGTDNWLITSEHISTGSGTPKTYVVKILESGVTTVLESQDAIPLKHAQATESNIIIGTDGTTAYIIGADGTTQGTYTTGGTLNDASISKSNGLYAIVGGQDNQAYFLNKYKSSSWALGQTVNFGETVLKTQISNDGTLALVGTANKFFLFKWDETLDSQYFINGVVIGSDGLPYANKYISVDANPILTDDNGFFVYPVKPGQMYTIVTGSKTTRYTATNQVLQTLTIKIQSQLIAQDVTFGASYNEQNESIEMHYSDAGNETSSVIWKVRNTKTGQTVYQQSVPAGQEAYYVVPEGNQSDNHFVLLEAERGNTKVKNTWSITPSGQGQFVNLFGMDDTGKNILFGFFLILLAGLFGYMHQHIGTIIIAFAAAVLRYLGLITVPWIVILIAVVVSIVAAIAHRGEGK